MRKFLTLLLLPLALAALLCACTVTTPPQETPPCTHTDADGDLHCDLCREELPKPDCTTHADANGNAQCDVCDKRLPATPCETHTNTNSDFFCDTCGRFVDETVTGWLLEGVPAYKGGTPSTALYLAGQGIDSEQPTKKENVMQTVSSTTAAHFAAYLAKLNMAGYEQEFYRTVDENLFASYLKGNVRVYTYFMSRTGEARIVKELTENSTALSAFEYTYEKKAGEQSELYQFALAMNDETHAKPNFKDNGMLYIIKLADNSVVIIDGANSNQIADERRDELMYLLWEITGSNVGDTVRIAGWYITHSHGDHYGGFVKFTWKYAKYLQLERVFFALPSVNSPHEVFNTGSGADGYLAVAKLIKEYYADDNTQFLRLHTGQSFMLADVYFDVLQTHEDLTDPASAQTKITNYNDASAIIRIDIDGATFLFLGDAGEKVAMPKILKNWSAEHLRTDGIQLAHHVMNDLSDLYEVVRAEVLFAPQAQYGIDISDKRVAIFAAAKAFAREDMVFLQNEATVGIAVVKGQWEVSYFKPFVY